MGQLAIDGWTFLAGWGAILLGIMLVLMSRRLGWWQAAQIVLGAVIVALVIWGLMAVLLVAVPPA